MALAPLYQHIQIYEALNKAILNKKMASTHILAGNPGVGKSLLALHIIQNLFCTNKLDSVACGDCSSCKKLEALQHENLHVVSPQGANIKIEQAREVIRFLSLKSQDQPQAVLILEAHKMNAQTSNALLKVIEEPPENSYIFICTSSLSALLATIRSRSQIWRLPNLKLETLQKIFPQVENTILLSAQGRADLVERNLIQSTEQLHQKSLSIWNEQVTPVSVLEAFQEEVKSREDFLILISLWQQQLRDACCIKAGKLDRLIFHNHKSELSELVKMSFESLESLFEDCLDMQQDMNYNVDKSMMLQVFALKLKEFQGVVLD